MSILDSPTDEPTDKSPIEAASANEGKESQNYQLSQPSLKVDAPLKMVETAFLASATSLIWFIDYYFPLGFSRIFFPLPIALVYLRWGKRASWMAALVSGLLLQVLMGPVRSLLFVIPFALMGVVLGTAWNRRTPWIVSISLGALLGTIGVFFRFWLLSQLTGEDLWVYLINEITDVLDWIVLQLGLLIVPNIFLIEIGAIALMILNNFIYLFVVHLAAWLLFDRLGNPIPRPPRWVQVLIDYE